MLLLISNSMVAQYGRGFAKHTNIGFGLGTSSYYGDLAPFNDFISSTSNSLRWNVSMDVSRQITPNIEVGLGISWIRLGADDANSNDSTRFIRNLHFRNDVKEFSIHGRYYWNKVGQNFVKRDNILPFIHAGLAYYIHNPQAKSPLSMSNEWVDLQPLHTEGQGLNPIYDNPYKLSGIAIQAGFGFKKKINRHTDISFEAVYRFLFTDYIDDVSMNYPNSLFFRDNKLAIAMSRRIEEPISARTEIDRIPKLYNLLNAPNDLNLELSEHGAISTRRGTGKGNDGFFTMTFKIRYLIADKIKCPKMK